jgi:CheY-like chemotaxis protein
VPTKILIADDSTTIQKVFERTFPADEFTLSFANNGEEALTKARTEKPQLIIADINMPAKNGFEVCEAAKNDPALKAIPILLLIGILDDFDEDESRRVGADGFIIKPFEANAAIGKVREILSKGGATPPLGESREGRTEEILELTDTIEGIPATPAPPPQGKGTEDILDLGDALKEPTPTPTPQEKVTEDIVDLGDIVAQSPPTKAPQPQEKQDNEFVLHTPLRDLETELKSEFPEEEEEDKEAETPFVHAEEEMKESSSLETELKMELPEESKEKEAEAPSLHAEEETEEFWNLDLDLPFDEMESEPRAKDSDWTKLFGDLNIEGSDQETKDERLGTILGESASELEKIEGLAQGKADDTEKKVEEFAEKFMDEFEPVFAPEEESQHIDTKKDLSITAREDAEDLGEKVTSAAGHELKEVVEEIIRKKVPELVREEIDRLKKE